MTQPIYATGRRKSATARVFMKQGTGQFLRRGRQFEQLGGCSAERCGRDPAASGFDPYRGSPAARRTRSGPVGLASCSLHGP